MQSIEVFGLTISHNDYLVGTGSTMEGSQRRALLLKLTKTGSLIWNNTYGFGDSFRSIFVTLSPDGGFCSLGGYHSDGTLNSYFIKTDSLGLIAQQGIGGDGEIQIIRAVNPARGSSIRIQINEAPGSRVEIALFDLTGRTVDRKTIYSAGSTENIVEFSGLETGVYLVKAESPGRTSQLLLTLLN